MGAHVRSNLSYMTCVRLLISSRAGTIRIFISEKTYFLHACETCYELPSNTSTMVKTALRRRGSRFSYFYNSGFILKFQRQIIFSLKNVKMSCKRLNFDFRGILNLDVKTESGCYHIMNTGSRSYLTLKTGSDRNTRILNPACQVLKKCWNLLFNTLVEA